jgi:hypothetical protein
MTLHKARNREGSETVGATQSRVGPLAPAGYELAYGAATQFGKFPPVLPGGKTHKGFLDARGNVSVSYYSVQHTRLGTTLPSQGLDGKLAVQVLVFP